IQDGQTFTLNLSAADADLPLNILTYTLVSGPSHASLSSDGTLSWPTVQADSGRTYPFTVKVTDNGTPPLSDTATFNVTVTIVNSAPVLAPVPDQVINELNPLLLNLSATDSDVPVNTLTYSLVNGPVGMLVNPTSGLLTWTPTEAQGPGTHP